MKTNFFILLLFSMIYSDVTGCNNHNIANISVEFRNLDKFKSIHLANSANVFITQGESQEIKIEGEKNNLNSITTVVRKDLLIINSKKDFYSSVPVNIYITVRDISLLHLSGSGNISMNNIVKFPNLEIQITGSGDIRAKVDSKFLKVALSGTGNLDIKGRTAESDIKISGSGNINGKGLQTFTSSINVSGSGTSTVDVTNELTINITGSGNVYYLTDPEKMFARSNGSGKVEKIS